MFLAGNPGMGSEAWRQPLGSAHPPSSLLPPVMQGWFEPLWRKRLEVKTEVVLVRDFVKLGAQTGTKYKLTWAENFLSTFLWLPEGWWFGELWMQVPMDTDGWTKAVVRETLGGSRKSGIKNIFIDIIFLACFL